MTSGTGRGRYSGQHGITYLFLFALLLAACTSNTPAKSESTVPLAPIGAVLPPSPGAMASGGQAAPAGAALPGEILATVSEAPSSFDGDVRELPPVAAAERPQESAVDAPPSRKPQARPNAASAPQYDAPVAPNLPSPSANFAGLAKGDACTGGLCGGGFPPDPVGDVGPNDYIQAVNTAVGIFSKTGTRLAAFTFNSLWSADSRSTPCKTQNFGDPTVVYDTMANRWIVADFAFTLDATGTPVAPFYECIAVSKTGDPIAGGWWLYPIDAATSLNDYPKMGIWPDGLYFSYNLFDGTGNFVGARVQALNRADIESGAAARIQSVDAGSSYFTLLPANLRGAQPPAGTPAYFVGEDLNAFVWNVFKFSVNWSNAALSSWTGPTRVSQAAYDPPTDSIGFTDIIPQRSSGTNLDSLGDRMMMQAQYRKIGSQESIWVVHTVRPAGAGTSGPTAVQWAELNVTGGTVAGSSKQQQIFTNGNDGLYRWVPSIAVDRAGNALLGYSASNANNDPSIRLAGRLVTDPPGTLGQGETTLFGGTASQNLNCGGAPCSRWGDYSAMTVDPTDDCTFWYTSEYYAATAPAGGGSYWQTRVASVKFPSCPASTSTKPGPYEALLPFLSR